LLLLFRDPAKSLHHNLGTTVSNWLQLTKHGAIVWTDIVMVQHWQPRFFVLME
jgi:hypothetical protein